MMTDLQEVEADIVECLSGLRTMESEVRRRAREQGIDPIMMRHADGALVMERLIISRAQLLTALAPIVAKRESDEKVEEALKGIRAHD
jgi:hypothetical protein